MQKGSKDLLSPFALWAYKRFGKHTLIVSKEVVVDKASKKVSQNDYFSILQKSQEIEKAELFRAQRIEKFKSDEPSAICNDPRGAFLHIVPLGVREKPLDYLSSVDVYNATKEIHSERNHTGFCYEGFYLSAYPRDNTRDYCIIWKDGKLEFFQPNIRNYGDDEYFERLHMSERRIIDSTKAALTFYENNSIKPPFGVFYSLTGVKAMTVKDSLYRFGSKPHEVHVTGCVELPYDTFNVPPVLIEDSKLDNIEGLLKGCFDSIWNAMGLPQSINYDKSGNYIL